MALMFQRLARNFAKNGYFPTDSETTAGILSKLHVDINTNKDSKGAIRIIDPCCGEGVALAECQVHLSQYNTTIESVGIEIDEERAYHARSMSNLNTVIHGNINDCYIGDRQFGLMLLNPPYGDMLSDNISTTAKDIDEKRLEIMFFNKCYPQLQFGGIMVLIIPHYVLNEQFASLITAHFDNISVYKAPEQKFKQIVLFANKKRSSPARMSVVKQLSKIASSTDELNIITQNVDKKVYKIPLCNKPQLLLLTKIGIDAKQLTDEVANSNSLWDSFNSYFVNNNNKSYSPLRKMSNWHLSLALAAGVISGIVSSKNKTLLVKGNTFKDKKNTTDTKVNEKTGAIKETIISIDIFVPVIKTIDFTKGSNSYGDVITIR